MSVLDKIFGSQQQLPMQQVQQRPVQQPAQRPAGQGNGVVPNQQGADPRANGNPAAFATVNPTAEQPAPTQQQEAPNTDPLAEFAKLWETDPNAKPDGPVFAIDPKKIREVASKANFRTKITPETMAIIAKGGPDAIEAMMNMMNTTAQNAYASSAEVSSRMIEKATAAAVERALKQVPGLINQRDLTNNLRTANPQFANPAVSPIVSVISQQLAVRNPTATPAELTEMAQTYLTNVAGIISNNGSPQAKERALAGKTAAGADYDWSGFLED